MESDTEPNVTMNVNTEDNDNINTQENAEHAVEEATQQVENQQQAQPKEETASLTLGLLKQVKNFMDVAIQRGIVKPEEMSTVGKMYDQYVAGLNNLTPK